VLLAQRTDHVRERARSAPSGLSGGDASNRLRCSGGSAAALEPLCEPVGGWVQEALKGEGTFDQSDSRMCLFFCVPCALCWFILSVSRHWPLPMGFSTMIKLCFLVLKPILGPFFVLFGIVQNSKQCAKSDVHIR